MEGGDVSPLWIDATRRVLWNRRLAAAVHNGAFIDRVALGRRKGIFALRRDGLERSIYIGHIMPS